MFFVVHTVLKIKMCGNAVLVHLLETKRTPIWQQVRFT